MTDQHELLLQLGSRSWSMQDQLEKHWLVCTQCRRSRTNEQMCALGQRLNHAHYEAFKAWDELDTKLNWPELARKEGIA
jgi:hypothetical protein